MKYRPEIDGLRAVAVCSVIAFHFDLFPGGYLGVDVFFVISGYLITSIIWNHLQSDRFTFRNFWGRRVRRIAPALFTVVVATLVAGHLILDGEPRDQMPLQALAATLSWSNMLTWWTIGDYWSVDAKNNPFLHCWSLSIEEQFYLVLPVILVLIHRLARSRIQAIITAGLIASLLTHFWLSTFATPESAFYLLPSRMWELLMGSWLAVRESDRAKTARLPLLGLVLVVASMILPGQAPIPNLIACAGTALFLSQRSHLLTWPVARYIGRISYSAYLWHWPVIVMAASLVPGRHVVILTLITFVLSVASYHLIETPFRRGFRYSPTLTVAFGLGAVIAAFLLPASPPAPETDTDPGVAAAFGPPGQLWREKKDYAAILAGDGGYVLNHVPDGPLIVLTGSSFARQFSIPLERYARAHGATAISSAVDGVEIGHLKNEPTSALKNRRKAGDYNAARLAFIQQMRPDVCIITGAWTAKMTEQIAVWSRYCGSVVVVSRMPVCDFKGGSIQWNANRNTVVPPAALIEASVHRARDQLSNLNLPNVEFVDIYDLFLNQDGSIIYHTEKTLWYCNDFHLSDAGSQYAFDQRIGPVLERVLADNEFTIPQSPATDDSGQRP